MSVLIQDARIAPIAHRYGSKMRRTLRQALVEGTTLRMVGAYDGFSAMLVEKAGFEGIWAGGLGISSSHGLPDAGLLTMTEFLAEAAQIRNVTSLPILADVDAGFGDLNVVQRMVRLYETSGIDGVCIEDKQGPKRNSFRNGNELANPAEFAYRIMLAKSAQRDSDFVVVARIESLIVGAPMSDALARAERYHDAGADAILIHSRSASPDEIQEFCAAWQGTGRKLPVFAIPTTYYNVTSQQLADMGIAGVIYANQTIRVAARALQDLLVTLSERGSSASAEPSMTALGDLFDLVGTNAMIGDQPWEELQAAATPDAGLPLRT